jgi:hypothetical protein
MATRTITFRHEVNGSLANATSVVLSDPTGAFGVKRNDTSAVVVVDATAMTNSGTGIYSYTFTEPAAGLAYTAYIEWVYGGETFRVERQLASVSTDLTTLARVKEYLEIATATTTWDDKLDTLITAVSRAVEFYCDRKFIAASYIEYHDGADAWRKGFISLNHSPVTAIARVSACPEAVITVRNTSTSVQRATVTVTSTGITRSRTASAVTTANTLLFADYATLTLLAAAITAVGNGWTASVLGDYGDYASGDLVYIQGALNAKTADAELLMHTFEPQYRLATSDTVATLFGHFMPGFHTVEVRYTAGYTTIPDAVQQGVVLAIKAIFDRSQVSSAGIKSEKIGDYSYTLADVDTSTSIDFCSPMFAEAAAFLQEYRRIRAL